MELAIQWGENHEMIVIWGLNLLTRSILTQDEFVIYKCPKCGALYRSMTWTSPSPGASERAFQLGLQRQVGVSSAKRQGEEYSTKKNGVMQRA